MRVCARACACVRAHARACARMRVRARACACVRAHARACARMRVRAPVWCVGNHRQTVTQGRRAAAATVRNSLTCR